MKASKELANAVQSVKGIWDEIEAIAPWERLRVGDAAEEALPQLVPKIQELESTYEELDDVIEYIDARDSAVLTGIKDGTTHTDLDLIRDRRWFLQALRLTRLFPEENSLSWDLANIQKSPVQNAATSQTEPDIALTEPSVATTLRAALHSFEVSVEGNDHPLEDQLDFHKAQRVVEAEYFTPDSWLTRRDKLRPIILNRGKTPLPSSVQSKLKELRWAYTFGLYQSVAALARSTVEQMLHDKGFNRRSDTDSSLRDLIAAARESNHPIHQKADGLDIVRRQGNAILHSKEGHSENIRDLQAAGTDDVARQCIATVMEAAELLYRS